MSSVATASTLIERYQKKFAKSHELANDAHTIFPSGITHDIRHLKPFPIYVDRAEGPHKWDVDGNHLIDYFGGHGALLLGHSHPEIVQAVQQQMSRATHPGACHELEMEWGRWVQKLIPSAEKVRFTGTGTEATMMALRLARIHTGKPKILKFLGHFHGWHDALAYCIDPPYEPANVPGIPDEVLQNTVVVPPNDPDAVAEAFKTDPEIGGVILEPTGGHWGAVPMGREFLTALRELTTKYDRLLIFDEVITGFRVHPGGAQEYYGIMPDLTTLAKILAGGLPGGAVAGRADVLGALEFRPGKVKMYHPGTFNANPLSASAGVTALRLVSDGEPCRRANEMAELLRQELNALFAKRDVNWAAYGAFSGCRILPNYDGPRPDSDDSVPYNGDWEKLDKPRNAELAHAFRVAMLLHGVDCMGFNFMMSATHSAEDVRHTVDAVNHAIDELQHEQTV